MRIVLGLKTSTTGTEIRSIVLRLAERAYQKLTLNRPRPQQEGVIYEL